jgi:hypothetical protein
LHGLELPHPWLQLHTDELSEQPANIELYHNMAALLGEKAAYVPAFFFCQQMLVGYASDDTTGQHELKRFGIQPIDDTRKALEER